MDGVQHQDPFLWDVHGVVEHLCTGPSPWTREPDALAARIRSEEVDGETLLAFEHNCSRQELEECLGIRLARHKAAFASAIFNLRAKSRAYQEWRQARRKQLGEIDDFPQTRPDGQSPTLNRSTPSRQNDNFQTPESEQPGTAIPEMLYNFAKEPETSPAPSMPPQSHDGRPPPQRKRIAPVNLGTKPVNRSAAPIPTEADAITGFGTVALKEGALPWENSPAYAYLGAGKLSDKTISSPNGLLSTRLLDLGEGDFATPLSNVLPNGRRQVVHRSMKRLLRGNSRKEALQGQGFVPMRTASPSESVDDHDPILELSDLPDSFDEQTLKEITEENLEAEKEKIRQAQRFLTQDQVQILLDDAIESMSAIWREKKLLKYERKAYKIWTNARRRGTRTKQILEAQRQAKFYDDRIKKLCTEILSVRWAKETEVKVQARCLEQNLDDKLQHIWLINMLESRTEPKRPHRLPALQRPAVRQPSLSDGEILTSADEEDFVVPDEEGNLVNGHDLAPIQDLYQIDRDRLSPMKSESPEYVDLTQVETPAKPRVKPKDRQTSPILIDLTTPTKMTHTTASSPVIGQDGDNLEQMVPRVEDFEPVENIGEKHPSEWVKANDRWRLAIALLYRLSHARRTTILEVIQERSDEEAWNLSVHQQMVDPLKDPSLLDTPKERLMAFDLTRVFLAFAKISHTKEDRIAQLGKRNRNRLTKAKKVGLFSTFCKFLRQMASCFPDETQIYRANDFGDDSDGEDEIEDGPESQGASQGRRLVTKEIVQNKDAVDLREREKRRAEELEERRLKLRATYAISDAMPRDKSRLIINESKQDDQSLIYVPHDISPRIKDHQIDGVRFLWNQIVLDPDVRQGCLLAHTMGLGKTMQVITLLVILQEAAVSPDPSVTVQIPHDLRKSKTLVLCPAGLVDNWMDELLMWAPKDLLGSLRRVDSVLTESERLAAIRGWAEDGGILTIGYNMFKKVLNQDVEIETILTDSANIVIADEAHLLKNPTAKITQVCSSFKTKSRIALTGSPLANNVEEYHSMIDWVAPNFLGPLVEFREIYANPIHTGLWTDSLPSEKRRALKMLQVLKETVAPKIHRATINSIKGDLPPKYEFVISVPPTTMQRKLYQLYVAAVQNGSMENGGRMSQHQVFRLVNDLALICNHPRCFRQKVLDVQAKLEKNEAVAFPQIISDALKETNSRDLDSPSLSLKVLLLMVVLDESRRLGDKVLVFSQSIPTLDFLSNLLKMQHRRVFRLDGSTAIGKRQEMTKNFNKGAYEVYLISTMAGGVGLNIQGANRVVIFDSKWNPVNDQQAIGRAYRIGQKKTVFVYRFHVAGSFEDDMQNKNVFKTQLSSRVVDKKNPVSWSKRLSALLHDLRPVPPKDLSEFKEKDEILDKLIAFKNNGAAILGIVSSDTFEEEDPTGDLTAEERQDAEKMVLRNRLRLTDPDEYARLIQKETEERLQRQTELVNQSRAQVASRPVAEAPAASPVVAPAPAPVAAPVNTTPVGTAPKVTVPVAMKPVASASALSTGYIPRQVNQTMDGAADSYTSPSQSSTPTFPPNAPLPLAGTNTFFGQRNLQPKDKEAPSVAPSPELFGQQLHPQAKYEFERMLADRLKGMGNAGFPGLTEFPDIIGRNLMLAIERVRAEKELGFFLDEQHWRLLTAMLPHDRFVLAIASGHVSNVTLAFITKQNLENRVARLNNQTDENFRQQLNRRMQPPDPQNLENIGKSSLRQPRNARAVADLKVMREAVDHRRQRLHRLPTWAQKELSQEKRS